MCQYGCISKSQCFMKKKLKIILKLGCHLRCHLNFNMSKTKCILFIVIDICAKIIQFSLEMIYSNLKIINFYENDGRSITQLSGVLVVVVYTVLKTNICICYLKTIKYLKQMQVTWRSTFAKPKHSLLALLPPGIVGAQLP